ncbi:MAG: DUF3343 domain-containing protein [Lachnospiraceae bacterium]
MRKKEARLVITFHTTAEAIAMEAACKAEAVSGRLIPVPRIISAGCGLAWSSPAADAEAVLAFMGRQELKYEAYGVYEI